MGLFLRILIAGIALLSCPAAGRAFDEPPVGFIWHFPFVDVGTDQVPAAGVSAMIARVPWREVEREPGQFTFNALDRQIVEAERSGYKLVLLLECNPFCTPVWLVRQAEAAGECVQDADGGTTGQGPFGAVPRADSPVYVSALDRYLREAVAHVRKADRSRVISHYQAGVEWWFPHSFRYAPSDVTRFHAWLARRYGSVDRLNAAWGSTLTAFDGVEPPRLVVDTLFARRSGFAPVKLLPGSRPTWTNVDAAVDDWHRFWCAEAAAVIDDLARRVKALDPSRPTMSFLTCSYAFSAEWDTVQWAAVTIDHVGRSARHIDELGMQLCVAHGDPHRIAAGLDVARKYGKPMHVLDLLDFTIGVRASQATMRAATHTAIQHGAAGLFYCCWNGAKDFNFHPDWRTPELRLMLDEGRRAIRLTRGLRVKPDAAIVLPMLPASPRDNGGCKNDPGSFIGWYRLLSELHQSVDVVTFGDLEARPLDVARYPWVLVPDCAFVPPTVLRRLAAYRAGGGRVVAAGRFAQRDETRRPLTGSASAAVRAARWPDDGRTYAGPLHRDAMAGDTPPLIQRPAPTPASEALRRRVGARLAAFLKAHSISPHVEVLTEHPDVAMTLLAGPGRRLAYLVNHAARPAEGVRVRLRAVSGERLSVLADLRPVPCRPQRQAGRLTITLPAFSACCLVRLERAAGAGAQDAKRGAAKGRSRLGQANEGGRRA